MDVPMCVVLLLIGGTFALTGKGFYCRDPDTGKLHPVNSTWKSMTFCGNYTCRLKKKDISTTPLREFKVSEFGTYETENISTEVKKSEQQIKTTDHPPNIDSKENNSDKQVSDIINKILNNITDPNEKRNISEIMKDSNTTDRYLNDKEIKLISDLLHSVKKSDLETVVDIYNIAQDIYKELDKKTMETIVEDKEPRSKKVEHDLLLNTIPNIHHHMVYGYEPIQLSQNAMSEIKDQESEILTPNALYQKIEHNELTDEYEPVKYQIPEKSENELDMHKEGSEHIPQIHLTPKFEDPIPTFISPMGSPPGFVKLPYYYQMSDFQRYNTYVNPHYQYSHTENNILQPVTEKSTEKNGNDVNKNIETSDIQKKINLHKPILLPYPYYQVRYNASGYPFNYFYGVNPYQDIYKKHYNPYYVTRTSYAEKAKASPERTFKAGSLVDTLLPKDDTKTSKTPEWKTESLSDDVLDEIRAHFENKNILFKPICLKKKIKLEKVGKVFKLDDFSNSREKRRATEESQVNEKDDIYEVYVEKIICQSDVDPGFFRIGNTSAPYPACCPQRIR